MVSDDFTRHYITRYLSARELVLPPLGQSGFGTTLIEKPVRYKVCRG